jgi:hypothetical protein
MREEASYPTLATRRRWWDVLFPAVVVVDLHLHRGDGDRSRRRRFHLHLRRRRLLRLLLGFGLGLALLNVSALADDVEELQRAVQCVRSELDAASSGRLRTRMHIREYTTRKKSETYTNHAFVKTVHQHLEQREGHHLVLPGETMSK